VKMKIMTGRRDLQLNKDPDSDGRLDGMVTNLNSAQIYP
jgi:hypothetical protein